ncbi:MAG: hypothetical protein C0475_08325 [Planctomyces sp.]|nr:hypothetical protein [Planctomyces sp.]MBA4039179.1 hypothetical protein [Planctomyces sp.]
MDIRSPSMTMGPVARTCRSSRVSTISVGAMNHERISTGGVVRSSAIRSTGPKESALAIATRPGSGLSGGG